MYEMLNRFELRLNRSIAAKISGSSWWTSSRIQVRSRRTLPLRTVGRTGKNGTTSRSGTESRSREARLSGWAATCPTWAERRGSATPTTIATAETAASAASTSRSGSRGRPAASQKNPTRRPPTAPSMLISWNEA